MQRFDIRWVNTASHAVSYERPTHLGMDGSILQCELHPTANPHQNETRQRNLQVCSVNRLQGIMKFFLISLASLGTISQVMALPHTSMLIV